MSYTFVTIYGSLLICSVFVFLLSQFSVFLGIIFFLELTAGVLAFVFKDWIKDQLNFFINNNIRAYRDDIDLQNLIDFTQEYVRQRVLMSQIEKTENTLGSENEERHKQDEREMLYVHRRKKANY